MCFSKQKKKKMLCAESWTRVRPQCFLWFHRGQSVLKSVAGHFWKVTQAKKTGWTQWPCLPIDAFTARIPKCILQYTGLLIKIAARICCRNIRHLFGSPIWTKTLECRDERAPCLQRWRNPDVRKGLMQLRWIQIVTRELGVSLRSN